MAQLDNTQEGSLLTCTGLASEQTSRQDLQDKIIDDPRISTINWKDVLTRALAIASREYRRYKWLTDCSSDAPQGFAAEDFVYDCVLKILVGQNSWPQHLDFFTVLINIIKRDINHMYRAQENKRTHRLSFLSSSEPKVIDILNHQDSAKGPEQRAIEEQLRDDVMRYLFERDPSLHQLAHLILCDGHRNSVDLAKIMSISKDDLSNLKKRLRRMLEEYKRTRA